MPQTSSDLPTRLPLQLRRASIEKSAIDQEARTVEFSFSSEARVERPYGIEILSHEPKAVDLSRLLDAAPLLDNHIPSDQIGVVEKAWLSARKGYAIARFSDSQRGSEIFHDICTGIRRNISVGYMVVAGSRIKEGRGREPDEFLISRWQPMELSVVALGADPTVGVGRSAPETFAVRMIDRTRGNMPDTADNENGTAESNLPAVIGETGIEIVREKTRSEETKRARHIREVARRFHCQDFGETAIDDGTSIADFEHRVLKEICHATPIDFTKTQRGLGLSNREKQSYSLLKAIREVISPAGLTGLERECSETIERELGTGAHSHRQTLSTGHSFYMPLDIPMSVRGMGVGNRMDVSITTSVGAELVPEQFLGSEFITYLRNALQVRAAGATVLDGLQGMVVVPKQAGPTSAYWLAETAPVTPSDIITTSVGLQPKRLSAQTIISRQLVIQSAIAVEELVRKDIADSIAEEIDRTALFGGTELPRDPVRPMGVFGAVALPPVPADPLDNVQTITYTGNPADLYAFYVEMIAMLDSQNIANNSRAFITNPSVWSAGMTTQRFPNGALPIIDSTATGNRVLGYPFLITNTVPGTGPYANRIVFGNWKDLLLGFWNNGLEIIVDPFSYATTAQISLVTSVFTDLNMRYRRSFVVSNNAPVLRLSGAKDDEIATKPASPGSSGRDKR